MRTVRAMLVLSMVMMALGVTAAVGAEQVLPGMVDTSKYAKPAPWLAGRAGLGDTNAWMTMFGLHFRYGIEEKYADFFKGYRVTSCFWNPVQQIADIESLVAQGVDILFIDPASEAALVGAVEEAMDAGVPVVLASTRVNTDKFVTWVSRDNIKAGYLYADWMGKKLPNGGKVVVLMGIAGSSYAEDVLRGVRQGLAAYPNIEIVGLAYCDWSPVKAKQAMEAFIQANPKIDGVIADGGQMALGAVEALLDAGRPIPPITADDWNGWLRMAKEHDIDFLAVSGGNPLALTCVDLAVQILQGKPVPKIVEYPIVTFEKDQLDKYYRPDLNDQYFAIHELPESWVVKYYGK
ncbi:substrate-binding domain-containing protein [Candidatus Bipolaricaulota bacterium]|nr:substrate-binding domain-containing protein [Candidatus Bipolaricaulota bacterium]